MPDTSTLQSIAVSTLIDALNGIITGANEDIQTFGNAIVADGIQAGAQGRLDLLPVLADQVKVLAEKQRLQVVAAEEATAVKLTFAILSFAAKLVIPPIPAI